MRWIIAALIFGPITTSLAYLFICVKRKIEYDQMTSKMLSRNEYIRTKVAFDYAHRRNHNPGLGQGI